jgi:predicted RNA-binding Zn-ribbon protein involved in translation (DUF1610 family)
LALADMFLQICIDLRRIELTAAEVPSASRPESIIVHKCAMSEDHTSTNEVICPVCGRPMLLPHTISRAFGENLNVFKCGCGFSMTEPVSWTTPPS